MKQRNPHLADAWGRQQLGRRPLRRFDSITAALLALASLSLLLSFMVAFWVGGIINFAGDATVSSSGGPLHPSPARGLDALKENREGRRRSGKAVQRNGEEEPDVCDSEFDRVNGDRTKGLSPESLERSRAWVGNKNRLRNVAETLADGRPLDVAVFGGSITLAHGVTKPQEWRYSSRLEDWLNRYYPRAARTPQQHRVFNLGTHGADICALSKRINLVLDDLAAEGANPSLFILEFGVNDYQGQDDLKHLDHKTDVFFDGFEELALCAEVVVNKLIRLEPQVAVMFLEFRTGIIERKTAQLLHMGVAQHYQIPVISYSEAMFPEFYHLLSLLNASDSFSAAKGEPILPYPYGCSPCRLDDITEPFRKHGCKSVCVIMSRNRIPCDEKKTPSGREPCFVPMFAHDLIHPSRVGHNIARDLIAHAIASASRDLCRKTPLQKHVLPTTGWLGSPKLLETRGDFLLVNDTMSTYSHRDKLTPRKHSQGWSYYSDTTGANYKPGWVTTNRQGGEVIEFEVNLPQYPCYSVYVAVLRSYVGMGKFSITVKDLQTKRTKTIDADGLWKAHISVWSDIQVTEDDKDVCTGKCIVRIRSHPEISGRGGNKVKVLTLSARKCAKQQR